MDVAICLPSDNAGSRVSGSGKHRSRNRYAIQERVEVWKYDMCSELAVKCPGLNSRK
jgi:hypothetical protein